MHTLETRDTETLLMTVVHDLRQPLATIGTSAYIMNLLSSDVPEHILEHIRVIERQVELAANVLNEAALRLRGGHPQRTEADILDFS